MVATAKSEDGFRKAQQLTEEATETPPNAVDRGMSLYLGASAQYKGAAAKPRLCHTFWAEVRDNLQTMVM